MDTSPALDAALSQERITIFICGQADLPGYTLRLTEASGEVTWAQGTFVGRDPRFGVLSAIDTVTDGTGDSAPSISISLLPPDETAAAELSSLEMQGSRVRFWLGAIDRSSNTVVDPYLIFDGMLDQPTLSVDKGTRELEYECVSNFDKVFKNDEGFRLSQSHQQEVWPGDAGLDDMTGVIKQIQWGPGDKIQGGFSTSGSFAGAVFGDRAYVREQ